MRVYTQKDTKRFVREVEDAGFEVEHYRGRNFWEGPAIRVDDLSEGIRATTVPVQWDNMGRGWIVYPMASDPGEDR